MAKITITRKQARDIIDRLPLDNIDTVNFFEDLMLALDNEQGSSPDTREGIEIEVTGTEM